ncbi:sulfatase-like hydrolase/transferase [Natrinema halophilum]|uniref:Sulfatase-like hydrolase/transferase n=1 Tax=Natrinema halophilum TaxID=1699371 RepID=A0A7D5GS09_9EURY|nr:sulfatase-like hydrolase/transferase [Natrinema halophilum]QLG48889.1 sulfatase-like hydrolase/transferase [Natrinema halophilum]
MRNVVLVCLDAVRKDVFDEYARRLRTRAGIEYTQARAVSGWSVPSHASMFTGTLPHEHGIHTFHRDFSGLTREETFLDRLPDHEVLGASANVYASDAFGFDELFDAYRSVSPDRRFPEGLDAERWGQEADETGMARYLAFLRSALRHERPLPSVANGVLVELDNWLADAPFEKPLDDGANIVAREAKRLVSEATEPFVLFTNFMDVHGPLTPVRSYDSSLYDARPSWSSRAFDGRAVERGEIDEIRDDITHHRELYAAATEYLDRVVDNLVDWLHSNTNNETTVVVTADHGENLGYEADRRLFAHRSGLTEGLLHVPLLVLNPPEVMESTVDDYVSHLRLGELVTGLATETVPDVTDDVIPAERIGFNVPVNPNATPLRDDDRAIRVAYEGDAKYQWDTLGNRHRYRLDPDRPSWQERDAQEVDISGYETTLFEVPIDEYRSRVETSSAERTAAVDDSVEDRLADLGYR